MDTYPPIRRRRSCVRGRAALLWAVMAFLAIQAGLFLVLHGHWPLRDPEFGRRLTALRRQLSERDPGRPLVLLLGSSRVAMNLRPGLMEANRRDAPGPIVFNFGLCSSGPMMEYLCLCRLLEAGVRPDLVLAELHYANLDWPNGETSELQLSRLNWSDVRTIAREFDDPRLLKQNWLKAHAVPSHGVRDYLLLQSMPWLLDSATRLKRVEWNIDDWGWLGRPTFGEDLPHMSPELRRGYADLHGKDYVPLAAVTRPSDHTRRAFAALAELCRRERVRLAFMLVPDPFLPRYPPTTDARLDEAYEGLGRDCGVPVIDLRDKAVAADFVEGVHMTTQGAARYTHTFEAEVLPHMGRGALEARWPPGRVRPTAEARRGLARREASRRSDHHVRSR